nr:hypothetical protein [Tanacetum cinerariifolium]
MARLQFCDYHNMVAILETGEFNSDFYPMVDFIAASPLRYALTVKPTIFVSHIRQFWSTARIETTDEGTHILATVDGIQRTIRTGQPLLSPPPCLMPRVTSPAADEGREAAAERISNDSEKVARVLTSMDTTIVLAGGIDVPTGSGFIPTVGPPITVISTSSEVGPTASPIVTRRKGKEVMVESDTPKKKKLQEQIDAHRRPMTKKQKREYYMAAIKSNLG